MEAALLLSDEYKSKKHIREISRNYVPDELLFEEILVRLPVKSLMVYKSVCKTWLYTIESRSFRVAYRSRHSRDYSDQIVFTSFESVSDPVTNSSSLLPSTYSFDPCLIKMTSRPLDVMLPLTRIEWPVIEPAEPGSGYQIIRRWKALVRVLGPIRTTGIYCIVASMQSMHWGSFPSLLSDKITICNPSMRDYKLANPFPPEEMVQPTAIKCYHVHYGFGVAGDGDYKVVVIITGRKPYTIFFSYIYSLKQGVWKKTVDPKAAMVSRIDLRGKPDFPQILADGELCPQAFLNGCWHWMAEFEDKSCTVLSFDMDNEGFKVMCGPPNYRAHEISGVARMVSVLNDHLALLYYMHGSANARWSEISVWMMMKYGDEESWINIWTVSLEPIPMRIPTLVGILYSSREDGNGGIHIDRVLFQDYNKYLVSCDEFGVVERQPGFDTSYCLIWNNLGISSYSETLERL